MEKFDRYDALAEAAMALNIRLTELNKRSETDPFWTKSAQETQNALNIIRQMVAEAGEELWPTK